MIFQTAREPPLGLGPDSGDAIRSRSADCSRGGVAWPVGNRRGLDGPEAPIRGDRLARPRWSRAKPGGGGIRGLRCIAVLRGITGLRGQFPVDRPFQDVFIERDQQGIAGGGIIDGRLVQHFFFFFCLPGRRDFHVGPLFVGKRFPVGHAGAVC